MSSHSNEPARGPQDRGHGDGGSGSTDPEADTGTNYVSNGPRNRPSFAVPRYKVGFNFAPSPVIPKEAQRPEPRVTPLQLRQIAAEFDICLTDDVLTYLFDVGAPVLYIASHFLTQTVSKGLSGTPFYQWVKFALLEYASDKPPYVRPTANPLRIFYPVNSRHVAYTLGYHATLVGNVRDMEDGWSAFARRELEERRASLDWNEVL